MKLLINLNIIGLILVNAVNSERSIHYELSRKHITVNPSNAINCSYQESKLTSVLDSNSSYGRSVSISGNFAVVGYYLDDTNGPGSGSAIIYEFDGTEWHLSEKLTPSDAEIGDHFGFSVSISGNNVLVGSYKNDEFGSNAGSAYVFTYDGEYWTETQKLFSNDSSPGDQFGFSVSISDTTAIIGSNGDDDEGLNSGSAYIFSVIDDVWFQTEKLSANDGEENDEFGFDVSISENYVMISAPYKDQLTSGLLSGKVYLFERSDNSWTHINSFESDQSGVNDSFGQKISLSDDFALIGASGNNSNGSESGTVYVYQRHINKWSHSSNLYAFDGSPGDLFGSSIAIHNDRAIVGAYRDDDNGSSSGSAYLFRFDGNKWNNENKFNASDPQTGAWFGFAVSISDNNSLISAIYDNTPNGDGAVYAYNKSLVCDDRIFYSGFDNLGL
jgi:hypothetical protein